MSENANAGFIWSIAELLRGDYKQSEYGKVILPFTLLRRLDCVVAPTKSAVLVEHQKTSTLSESLRVMALKSASGLSFYNASRFDFEKLLGEPQNIKANLLDYVNGWSEETRDIFERYDFENQIVRLDGADLLFQVVQKFAAKILISSPEKSKSQSQEGGGFLSVAPIRASRSKESQKMGV
jgi:type I restriction enzyme M protein